MSNERSQTAGTARLDLAGVFALVQPGLPHADDIRAWVASYLGDQATLREILADGGGTSWTPSKDDNDVLEWDDIRDNSCLLIASRMGHEGAVRELLESGVDVNEEGRTRDGATALWGAAGGGHEGVVELLLKAGADVDKATTDYGVTPLYFAAEKGHEGVVEQLLKAGADSPLSFSSLQRKATRAWLSCS